MERLVNDRGAYSVSVSKDYLVFSSAHFITFEGHRCEGLHGHNYRVRATVEGALRDDTWLVFDFVTLKQIMRKLCEELDHLVLLPLENPRIAVVEDGTVVRVAVDGRAKYLFPRDECALLPVPNTTVEMLARLLSDRLEQALQARGESGLTCIEIDVEENFGQTASYRVQMR